MVQAEHAREKIPIGAGEVFRQSSITAGNGNLFASEQRVLLALAAASPQCVAFSFQDRTDPHAAVIMQEVEGRVMRNAEQEVFQGG